MRRRPQKLAYRPMPFSVRALLFFSPAEEVPLHLFTLLPLLEGRRGKRYRSGKIFMDGLSWPWPGRYCPILRPRKGSNTPIDFRILGPFLDVKLHWLKDDGSTPCWGERCTMCPSRRVFTRWYAPALSPQLDEAAGKHVWKPAILELFDAHEQVISQGRGLAVKVFCSKSGERICQIVNRIASELAERGLPPGFPVEPYLERIFGKPLHWTGCDNQDENPEVLKFERRKEA